MRCPTRQSTGPARKAAQAGYFYVSLVGTYIDGKISNIHKL